MGEMTSETGIAHECIKYSRNKKLPIHFIVEDNGKSVCTDTRKTWSQKKLTYEKSSDKYERGHVIADANGGSRELDNFVPEVKQSNRKLY